MSARRGERGSALLLACLVVLVLSCLAAVLVLAGALRAEGERVRGAADLAALAGARAQAQAADACTATRASAELNDVELIGCGVHGDEVEFVVSAEVRSGIRFGPTQRWLTARAHAGMVTGAPE